jgi:hypothetical protein
MCVCIADKINHHGGPVYIYLAEILVKFSPIIDFLKIDSVHFVFRKKSVIFGAWLIIVQEWSNIKNQT